MLLSGRTVTSKQFLWQTQTLTVSLCSSLFVPLVPLGGPSVGGWSRCGSPVNRLLCGRSWLCPVWSCSWRLAAEQSGPLSKHSSSGGTALLAPGLGLRRLLVRGYHDSNELTEAGWMASPMRWT